MSRSVRGYFEEGKCVVCGKPISAWSRRDKRFCSDECRYTWNNNQRKADRLLKKAQKAIQDLRKMRREGEIDEQTANKHLQVIAWDAKAGEAVWKCNECGQTTFVKPDDDGYCPYCEKKTMWSNLFE